MKLHTKYQCFRPCGFRQEDIFMFHDISFCKTCDHEGVLLAQRHNLNKPCDANVRGPKVVIDLRSSVFFWPRSFPSKSSKLLRGGTI